MHLTRFSPERIQLADSCILAISYRILLDTGACANAELRILICNHTWTEESLFSFSKNVWIFSYSNAEFKHVHSDNTSNPSVRGEGSLFPFSEIVSTLSYCTAMQNSKIHPGTKPGPTDLRLRGRKVFSFSENVLKLNYNNAEFKFCPGTILRTPVSGEKAVCFCSPEMKQILLQ